jgi:probable phosphoglycerate mutase
MTKILMIRHALTDTAGKKLSGRTKGIPLNAEGRKQAIALAEKLSLYPINAIYSSPLERTLETASLIAARHDLHVVTSEEFTEMDYGRWTNMEISDIRNDPDFILYNTYRSITRIPGGELVIEAQNRIISGLQKLVAEYEGKTVAVVTHADLIKAAISYYLGLPLDMMKRIEISPASVSIVETGKDFIRVSLLNYKTDLP